ncbi:MAG: hypothetical protein UZ12_BCD005003179 [Bacteroidetes bacterium OLB12]|nr:MAG: hypothetical protein UZ12_BCD005003179 [Bacteroidetes bacterium OLB12]
MTRIITLIILSLCCGNGYGQVIVKDTLPPAFEWSLYLIDAPYMTDAAKTEAIRDNGGTAPYNAGLSAQHYGRFYRNLSMAQATDMARNLHGSLYYGHNVLWNKFVKPVNTRKYILNRVLANITALGTDYLAIKLPYGYAFQHEEFHRAVMTTRHIYSYDEVWSFGKGLDIAVTHVKDEDLMYLKENFPADQVRLSAAGVEGEYRYLQRMREDNFFKQTGYPMVGISLLGTLHAVNYVNLPFTKRFNAITDSIMVHDRQNILARDFTGYDFSAWVYDLFTPNEPYEARGTWPGGVGIKRPVKESDLTPEMKSFLSETGNMQYLNFVSPFMVGINRLQLKPGYYFNFALRSVPASFGYFAGGDFFLDFNNRQMMVSLGVNRSKNLTLPSVELRYYNLIKNENSKFNTNLQVAGWMQPKDQLFAADKAESGITIGVQPSYAITERFSMIADLSYKTKGWVFGNPYLDNKFTGRVGFSMKTR